MNEIKTAIEATVNEFFDSNKLVTPIGGNYTQDWTDGYDAAMENARSPIIYRIGQVFEALTASAEREAFEKWIAEAMPDLLPLSRNFDDYQRVGTQMAWEAWQARASLAADTNLRLAKVEQEPVAKVDYLKGHYEDGLQAFILDEAKVKEGMLLYTAPQAQEQAEAQKDAWITPQVEKHLVSQFEAGRKVGWNAAMAEVQAETQYAHKPECDLLKPATLNGYAVMRNCDCGHLEQAEAQHSKGERE